MAASAAPASGLNRRTFLGYGMAAAALALTPRAVLAATAQSAADRVLSFLHTHTGERLEVAYCCRGQYQPEALRAIDVLLRDFRTNEVRPIDPNLLDLLHELSLKLSGDHAFHVISGYRSPQTNAMLRARSGAATGVASGSLHMVGKAIDIRMPGVRLHRLRDTARAIGGGGVGYYPTSDFVHVDTGRIRYW